MVMWSIYCKRELICVMTFRAIAFTVDSVEADDIASTSLFKLLGSHPPFPEVVTRIILE